MSKDVNEEVEESLEAGKRKVGNYIKSKGRKAIAKVGKNVGKRVTKEAVKKGVHAGLMSLLSILGWWILAIILIIVIVPIVIKMSDDMITETKTYSSLVESNSVQKDFVNDYSDDDSEDVSMMSRASRSSWSSDISGSSINRIKLSEGNQAIENYHYYKAKESVLNNKVYIGVKGIDLEKKDEELIKELKKKGVISEEGTEIFVESGSLDKFQKEWQDKTGSGAAFNWTDSDLKDSMNGSVNSGLKINGFSEKQLSKLKTVDEEDSKGKIKDAFDREQYFQLPEELLGVLNQKMYNDEFIYDDPFVQGVKYSYTLEDKDEKKDKKKKVNTSKAKNDYTAELFNEYLSEGALKGKGSEFIKYAKKYDVDAALLVAIACKESDYGKDIDSNGKNNVFYIEPYATTQANYDTLEKGIEEGIAYISRRYMAQGVVELKEIGRKYRPAVYKEWELNIGDIYKTITGKEYDPSKVGKGIGSDMSDFSTVPNYKFKLDTKGMKGDVSNYGLGTVFVYKPSFTIEMKRGVSVSETLKKTGEKKTLIKESKPVEYKGESVESVRGTAEVEVDGKKEKVDTITEYEIIEKEIDGKKKKQKITRVYKVEAKYDATAEATPVEDVKAEVVYLLDKAITFAGVYEFEYELVSEEVGAESNMSERDVTSDGKNKEYEYTESRTIKMYEKPSDVKCRNISTRYMDVYLKNFRGKVPKHVINDFGIKRLVNSFKGVKGDVSTASDSDGESGDAGVATSDHQNVEKWRDLAEEYGEKYGIDPNLLLVLIFTESSGNPHNSSPKSYYWGLLSMGDNSIPKDLGGHDLYLYFDKSSLNLSRDPNTDSRLPHCSGGTHDEKEHERVGRLHLEYVCKRLGNMMTVHSKKMFNKSPESLTKEELFYVIMAAYCSYATGEGGQNSVRKAAGYNYALLYSPNGEQYKKYHTLADKARGGDLNSKFGMNEFLERAYKNYSIFSGGISLAEIADKCDPSKWFSLGNANGVSVDSAAEGITTSSNGTQMSSEKVKAYLDYEVYGEDFSKYGESSEDDKSKKVNKKKAAIRTVVKSKEAVESEKIRNAAIAMIKTKSVSELDNSDKVDVFWNKGYDLEYFSNGIQAKPLYGDEMSQSNWSTKIRESTMYKGDEKSLLKLAASYGKEIYKIIKRCVEIDETKYAKGGEGPYSFDNGGLIWYVFNTNSGKDYFKKGTVKDHYDKLTEEVGQVDIRPTDIIFYSKASDNSEEPTRAGIYLGHNAYLGIADNMVQILSFPDLRDNDNIKIHCIKRVVKFGGTNSEATIEGLAELPEGLGSGDFLNPLEGGDWTLTCKIGMRTHPVTGEKNSFHRGIDLAAPKGTKTYASRAGKIIRANLESVKASSYGNYVIIDHGDGYTSLYAHLNTVTVKEGDDVKQGQLVGTVGSTGRSTGPHLHFEIVYGVKNHISNRLGVYKAGDYIDPEMAIKTLRDRNK